MKKIIILLTVVTICVTSSFAQQKNLPIKINYKAKATNFAYELQLNQGFLKILENGQKKEVKLTNGQLTELNNFFNSINLHGIESNIDLDNVESGKSIKASCILFYQEKMHAYQIDHKNPPKEIKELFVILEGYFH